MIELEEDDVLIIEAMLHFMYHFDYDDDYDGYSSPIDHGPYLPMMFNVNMYTIADKYDIPSLKVAAKKKFGSAVKFYWRRSHLMVTNVLVEVISAVYNSTPTTNEGLRDVLAQVAHEQIEYLVDDDDFRHVLEQYPRFAIDIMSRMARA